MFARAREKARQTSCLSNVRQIILAARMYIDSNDEMFPMFYNIATGARWYQLLYPYIRDDAVYPAVGMIWRCPSARGIYYDMMQYPCNRQLMGRGGEEGDPCSLGQIMNPVRIILLLDGANYHAHYYMIDTPAPFYYIPGTACGRDPDTFGTWEPAQKSDFVNGRHNMGVNCGYVDGHAKWIAGCALAAHEECWDPFL